MAGGKSREIDKIEPHIPEYGRYIEPLFGDGALFFHLQPKQAAINDISESLIQYYTLIKNQDRTLYNLLMCYNNSFGNLVNVCSTESAFLSDTFFSKGEFNIPYGGMSYNRKNMRSKIDGMFNREIATLFSDTEIYCSDFEQFFKNVNLTERDFMFLDPPYDTDFSDYEGKDFTNATLNTL